jgi:glucose-1-phosphate thymidylyltransferase
MNCWLFTPEIFDACRRVEMSPRGELELPRAVQLAIDTMGLRFRVVRVAEPVLDLSTRGDVRAVESLLAKKTPRL